MSSYGDLLTILRQQSDTVSQLIELTTAERRAIADRDLAALTSVTSEKTVLAERLHDLEGRRRDVALELGGAEPSGGNAPTLRELLDGASGPEADQLRALASSLPVHLGRLGEETQVNKQLVMSALGIVTSALEFLRPMSDAPGTYGPNSNGKPTAPASLDRRA